MQNHTHLKGFPSIRTFLPVQYDYVQPHGTIEIVIDRLSKEDRRLDQINGGKGSLANALAKELYGDENEDTKWYLFLNVALSKNYLFQLSYMLKLM